MAAVAEMAAMGFVPDQVRERAAAQPFGQNRHDLALAELRLPHRPSSSKKRKSLFLTCLPFGEAYVPTRWLEDMRHVNY